MQNMYLRISPTLKKLLIVYGVIFLVQTIVDRFLGGDFRGWFSLTPSEVMQGKIWQIFTYQFLHVDVMHLVLNLLILAFVGSDIEALWGKRRFFIYYFFCILVAGTLYMLLQLMIWNPAYLVTPMMGASGGIYGLLLAYGILFPDREMLFMMIFPMKSKHFVILLAGIEFLQAISSSQSGLSAVAHLSGMGAGYFYLWIQAKGARLSFKKQAKTSSKKKSSHLKLVQNPPPRDDDDSRGPKTWH